MATLYQVSFRHQGRLVRLPILRTAAQVADLKTRYADVKAVAAPQSRLNEFSEAVKALGLLYRAAKAKGDTVMAARAEVAQGALFGLSADDLCDETMSGVETRE